VYYKQPLDIPNAPFLVMDLLHHVTLRDGGSIITNMLHMIMDVMTNDYFAPLRTKIEHEVEAARVIRAEHNMVNRAMTALNTASCGELEPTFDEMKAALKAAHNILGKT